MSRVPIGIKNYVIVKRHSVINIIILINIIMLFRNKLF